MSEHEEDVAGETPKTIRLSPPKSQEELAIEELKRHQEEIETKIRELKLAKKREVLQQIKDIAEIYEITIEKIVEAFGGIKLKRRGVKAVPKYRDPVSGVTWSGRGKEPLWIRDKNRDDFLI